MFGHVYFSGVHIPKSGIAESLGNSVFSLFDELPDYFLKQLPHFTFPSAMYEGSNVYISFPKLVTVFLIIPIIVGVKWYLMILICIPVMADHVEHHFLWLLAICVSFQILGPFFNWVVFFMIDLFIYSENKFPSKINLF